MSRFQTLMLREWMQHRRGWLILMCVPAIFVLVLVAISLFGESMSIVAFNMRPATPMPAMLVATLLGLFALPALTWGAILFQAPGLARRDRQDRSIEFWRSLPVDHASSVGAPVLMHALLVPLLAMVIGYAFSQAIGVLMVGRIGGFAALASLQWGEVLVTGLAMLARGLLGVTLASLWLSPIFLLAMAASAWMKRWGAPVVGVALAIGHPVLSQVYGLHWIGETFTALLGGARRSLVYGRPPMWEGGADSAARADGWPVTPQWLASDALDAVTNLWQPFFGFAILFSAACFGLLVLHRRRAV